MADVVKVNDRFGIDSGRPLPEYDSPSAKAYACQEGNRDVDLLALIGDPLVPFRNDAIRGLKNFSGIGLMRVHDYGVVNWMPAGRRVPVLVMDRPRGGRVFADRDAEIRPFTDEEVARDFLPPLVATLREMSQRGITHRNIRPDNLFHADSARRTVVLGECVSAPPGLYQPDRYESLESAMADPEARGEGGIPDDLFSAGATLLALLTGHMPEEAPDPQRLILDRINLGSYACLAGGMRLQMDMVEMLRGLMSDDPRERWTIRDIELWLGGRRLTPKQVKLPRKAGRPLAVGGSSQENVRAVAHVLARNWNMVGDLVRGSDFDNWLRRSLGNQNVVESVNRVTGGAGGIQAVPADETPRLVTRIAIGLDPSAPIRHKGFSAHIDGIGTALALGFNDERIRQHVAALVNSRSVGPWMSVQTRSRQDLLELFAKFDKLPSVLGNPGPGYGIERVLYELNAHVHCRSLMLEHLHVTDPGEIIPALEAVAQQERRPPIPMDRHVAAFLGARMKEIDDRLLRPLGYSGDTGPAADALNVLRVLARVQGIAGNGPAPGLCDWLADLTRPAVGSFHNLRTRADIGNSVMRAAQSGQLGEILAIFDDQRTRQRDQQGYQRARQEFTQCNIRIEQLDLDLQNKDNLASELGEQAAAVVSGVIGSIGTTVIFVLYLI